MKKSIIVLSAFLLLLVLFSAPSQADIMSAEDRAILRTQLESTPVGEGDPWDEIECTQPPVIEDDDQANEIATTVGDEVDNKSISDMICDFITSIVLGEMD